MDIMYDTYKTYYQDIFNIRDNINISFEFFPPKDSSLQNSNLISIIEKLSIFKPNFISITCTAEKNPIRNYTYDAIQSIPKRLNLNISPHITYANYSIEEIQLLAKNYWKNGIRSVVALRGDRENHDQSKVYAYELVNILKNIADFDISVAAYPEGHPEAQDLESDLLYLKKKIDCGANRAITQFFFDPDQYLRFRDRCLDAQINVDIIPGILPIINFKQLKKFIQLTNVRVPNWMNKIFNNLNHNDIEINKMIGLIISFNIIKKLCQEGVNNFHFYTLNHVESTYALCSILKLHHKN